MKNVIEEFKKEWFEKIDGLLDSCGFEKDNKKHPEIQSTTKRSEALGLQAFLYAMTISFLEKTIEEHKWEKETLVSEMRQKCDIELEIQEEKIKKDLKK